VDRRRPAITRPCRCPGQVQLIDRAAERELAPAWTQFGLSIIPFAPLHGGLLAGMGILEREVYGDMRFAGPGFSDAELRVGRAVEQVSHEWGLQPYQVSLAWLLSRPAVASVIVGAKSVDELTANASAFDIQLEPSQLDYLTAQTVETSSS
jgi:aryl-alcohol dehydrogenase-like predicted oxidoreductase